MSDILITGVGAIAAIGPDLASFWDSLQAARHGIGVLPMDETRAGAPVQGFTPKTRMKPGVYRRMSRVSRMAVAACLDAIADAGLDLDAVDKRRIAIVGGTGHGSSEHVEDFFVSLLSEGPRGAQPGLFPETVPNAPASHVAMVTKITGPNTTFSHNDLSGENALAYGRRLVAAGTVDAALVVGADELGRMVHDCYDALRLLQPVSETPRIGRGLVMGEGAGAVLLESEAHARARQATPYARIAAVCQRAAAGDPGDYTGIGPVLAQAIDQALVDADVTISDLDQVLVSANFSGGLETQEADALATINEAIAGVTPTRYLTGSFGGAGILSTVAAALSIRHQVRLPAIGLDALTDAQPEVNWQPATSGEVNNILLTAGTCGGGCAATVVQKAD